jgi:hypothetical protein
LTVRLEPCGEALGRVADRAGKPVARVRALFYRQENGMSVLAETDPQGRFRAALVPGLKYRGRLSTPLRLSEDPGDLEVGPGQVRDLGEVRLTD